MAQKSDGDFRKYFLSGKKKVMEEKRTALLILDIVLELYEDLVFGTVAAMM